MVRFRNRAADALRPFSMTRRFQHGPAGSVLMTMGNTKVICAASVEERVPFFLRGTGRGWITAEYSLLPSATAERTPREAVRGRQNGRTHEIERLIGRALRSVVDLEALGARTIHIDCDVIEADGGTRTASVTGAFLALVEACATFFSRGKDQKFPVKDFLAAVSVGIGKTGEPLLDLCYAEDAAAIVDMNIAMTAAGGFVDLQGTGEGRPYTREELDRLLILGEKGIRELIAAQKEALGMDLCWLVGRVG